MRFAQGASAARDEREEQTLEEASGLVQRFLERVVYMHVKLLVFTDIVTDALKQDRIDEFLGYGWLG